MLEIFLPPNNTAEKEYIIYELFENHLSQEYIVSYHEQECYRIILPNRKSLNIKDAFFSYYKSDLSYFEFSTIPSNILYVENSFVFDKNIPIIFGDNELIVEDNQISVGIDIFASCFFMLSRWEEYVSQEKDKHDRNFAKSSLAYKFNFLERPIVNEYTEFLWKLLKHLDPSLVRKERKARTIVSCDVDYPYDLAKNSVIHTARRSLGLVLKGNYSKFHYPILNYLRGKEDTKYDLYNSRINWIMDVNEKCGNRVTFNFIPFQTDPNFDGQFNITDPIIEKLLVNIVQRGHELGVHPGYQTYNNAELFKQSVEIFKSQLERLGIDSSRLGGRQHYLRWKFPETLSFYEQARLQYDSTLGYADCAGFRCGTCYEYTLFDVLNRKTLALKERPLIVMEGTVFDKQYMNLGHTYSAGNQMLYYKNTCKKYNGDFTLLWHNTYFQTASDEALYIDLTS
jgi:hypothetical protein